MEPKTCHHCGNEWTPRKAEPKKCPRCMNPLWKSPRPKRKASTSPEVEIVRVPRSEWPESVVKKLDEAINSNIDECVRAPIEDKDSLSQMKQRAESLLSKLI